MNILFSCHHSPTHPSPLLSSCLFLQIITAGDAFANFIDPAAPQPSNLHGRLVALVPTSLGLQVTAVPVFGSNCLTPACHLQRIPLEFGVYVGAQSAEQSSWKPKMGSYAPKHANGSSSS